MSNHLIWCINYLLTPCLDVLCSLNNACTGKLNNLPLYKRQRYLLQFPKQGTLDMLHCPSKCLNKTTSETPKRQLIALLNSRQSSIENLPKYFDIETENVLKLLTVNKHRHFQQNK